MDFLNEKVETTQHVEDNHKSDIEDPNNDNNGEVTAKTKLAILVS